jgi:hypothetical protein
MQCQQPKHNNFSPCNETSNNESTASFFQQPSRCFPPLLQVTFIPQ